MMQIMIQHCVVGDDVALGHCHDWAVRTLSQASRRYLSMGQGRVYCMMKTCEWLLCRFFDARHLAPRSERLSTSSLPHVTPSG